MRNESPAAMAPPVARPRGLRGARGSEKGAVLLTVLLVLLTLLGLGVTSIWLTGGNLQMSASMNMRSSALYCAQAGIDRARAHMNTAPRAAVSAFLTNLLSGSGRQLDDVPKAIDERGQPDGLGAVFRDASGTLDNVTYPPASFARGANTAATMGNFTVWIRNDIAEIRSGSFTADTNGVVTVRSRCVAPDGRTNVAVEVTFQPPVSGAWSPLADECLDSGKNNNNANSNTVHCNQTQ